MASRPVFIPVDKGRNFIREISIEFEWHAGFSISQKQKSIRALHEAATARLNLNNILEISSKSEVDIGKKLSAFNLRFHLPTGIPCTVETIYQGSKVFSEGGPFSDLFGLNSRAAKKDIRLKNSGRLIGFEFDGERWPTDPIHYFYDFIYIKSLTQNETLTNSIQDYDAFTDIEFNPKKSINCQARSAALYLSLLKENILNKALNDRDYFLSLYKNGKRTSAQGNLF